MDTVELSGERQILMAALAYRRRDASASLAGAPPRLGVSGAEERD